MAKGAVAQEVHFIDTIKEYNHERIIINTNGALFIGALGVANIADGAIGYSAAKKDEWKSFHAMNLIWGVGDVATSGIGILRARRQAGKRLSPKKAYEDYIVDKRACLVSIFFDVAATGVGAALVQANKNSTGVTAAQTTGYGKALVVQGVIHLVFDNVMYRAHLNYNSRWAQLLDEMRFTGNGISFNYTFPVHHISD